MAGPTAGVGRKKKTRRDYLGFSAPVEWGLFIIAEQIYRSALAMYEPSAARTRRLSLAQRELALSLAQRLGHHHFGSPTSPPRPHTLG